MPPIPDLLRSAASLAQMGQLDMAADTCRDILKNSPATPKALRLLGMIGLQEGDTAIAITSLTAAAVDFPALFGPAGMTTLDPLIAALQSACPRANCAD